jgi:hypothetical protein
MQNSVAFVPDQIKIVDVLFVTVVESYLFTISIVLQLPVRRGCNDEMD